MNVQMLLYRLRWLHVPAGILMMLLQRTPILRLVTGGASAGFGLQSGELLKSAFALAALGAYNSVAGATLFQATPQGTTTVTPLSGAAKSIFTASGGAGSALSLTFNLSGAPGGALSKSWKATGTLPPGVSVVGGIATTGGYYANLGYLTLTGTPTTAGSYPLTITAYDKLDIPAKANSAYVSCTITVTGGVSIAPTFTTQPSSQTVTAGANVSFTAAASGTPAPTLQWYKDSVALSGQTSTTLSLTSVQSSNAGSYTVKATNTAAPSGVSSNAATLTVNTVPAFTTQPTTQTVNTGANVTFTSVATGSPTPTFQWYKDNVALSGQTNATLSLTNVQSASTGSYKVVATNSAAPSGISSNTASLTLAQTITFGALSGKTYGNAPFTVSATASSSLTPTFSIVSGPATISGSTITITGVGTVVVRASQAGNTSYAAATAVDQSFSVAQAAQTITFGALSSKTYGNAAFTVSATASSSLTPTFSIFSGPATISGSTITLTGVGTVVVRASQSGNANYSAATAVDQSFSVAQATQTITFGTLSGKSYGDASFTVSATASSSLTPTFSIFSGPATLSGSTVTITGAGTVVVRASQTGNTNYAAATPVDQSFSVAQAAQTITFGTLSSKAYGDVPFTVSATASSGLTPTFSIFSGPATISGSTVTITGTGTVVVRASQAGNANYAAAPPVDQSFTVGLTAQTITFGTLSSKTYGDTPFTVSATASSGLTPTFSIFSGPATISGSTITITGVGTVVVRASQAGNTNYAAATSVDQSFSVSKATASVTLGSLSQSYTGSALSATASTTPSGLTVAFTYNASATAPTNAGSYAVVGTINDSLYQGSANGTLVISPVAQTITFGALSGKTYGNAPFTVSATASSGLTPTFSIVSGPATISGSTVTLTGGGTVVVRASQSGNSNYTAATSVDQSFSVTAAPVFTTQPSTQTTFVGSTVTLTAVATGTPTPTLQWYKDNVALSGKTTATLSLSNVQTGDAGSYSVTATNSAAPSGVASNAATLTVNPAPVAPTFTTQPSSQTVTAGDSVTFSVVVTGTPTPTLQWYKDNVALSGQTNATLSLTNVQSGNAGSYTVKAINSTAPSGVSSAAAILTVNPAPVAPTFTTQPQSQTAIVGATVTFTAVATGIPTPTLQWYKDNVAISGQTGGTLTLTAVQFGDDVGYSVKATNSQAPGGVTSATATLTLSLAPAAPVITLQPAASTTATIGDTITLSVDAIGIPTPSYQWKRAGVNLAGQTGTTLTLANIQLAAAGDYTVLVTNSTAPKGVLSNKAVVSVVVPPPATVTSGINPFLGERVSIDLSGGQTYPAGILFYSSKLPAGLTLDSASGQISGVSSAKPGTYGITYWTQSGKTRSAVYSLTLTIQGFPEELSGNFESLIDDATENAEAPLPVGKLELSVSANGAFTGRLTTADPTVYALRGNLVLSGDHIQGTTTVTVVRKKIKNAPAYLLTLAVANDGSVSVTLATSAGPLGSGVGAKLSGTSLAGTYTMVMHNPVNLGTITNFPQGAGYFVVTGTTAGKLTIKGKTGDGVAVTAAMSLGTDNVLRLYAKPYPAAGGYLGGTFGLTVRDDNTSLRHITANNGADLYWVKPAISKDKTYPNGFGPLALEAVMEPWNANPTSGLATQLGLPESRNFSVDVTGLTVSDGDHDTDESITLPTMLNLNSKNVHTVVGDNPSKWSTKLTSKTGAYKGTAYPTDKSGAHKATIEGVMIQPAPGDTLIGGGYILVPAQDGDNRPATASVEFSTP
ncbi:MAG: immunoglobulin domain-containing protein [Opitutaceae bacterium]|jgi:ribosomal protein S11